MPNSRTHNHIAAQVYGSEMHDFMLASALPAYRDEYNDRYGRQKGIVELDGLCAMANAGISFSRLIDSTFEAQPEYGHIIQPLADDLQAGGVPPEAAILTAAFGAEIMIDGAVMDCIVPRQNFDNLTEASTHAEIGIYTGMDEKLVSYIRGFLNDPNTKDLYRSPRDVGMLVYKRLDGRATSARERIPGHQIPHVEQMLMHHHDRIADLGLEAVSRTIRILSAQDSAEAVETGQSTNISAQS